MAVAMFMRWQGVGPEQYDHVRTMVDFEQDLPDGAIYHVCAFDDESMRIVDVWESREQFERFMAERLSPAIAEAGMSGEPEVEFLPVHFEFAPGY